MNGQQLTQDDVTRQRELPQALRLMRRCGIETNKVKEIEDAQQRLIKHMYKQRGQEVGEKPDDPGDLGELSSHTAACRTQMAGLVSEVLALVRQLPKPRLKELLIAYPDVVENLTGLITRLKDTNNGALLVTGEALAGKSSLINLMLGKLDPSLLPESNTDPTSTIIEVKYKDVKYLVAHPVPSGSRTSLPVRMNPEEKMYTREIDKYCWRESSQGMDNGHAACYKVEVCGPVASWLKNGLTLVEGPPAEEEEMSHFLKKYVERVFGIIYVINASRKDGIKADKIQDLLLTNKKSIRPTAWEVNPRSVIFVVNKWDEVPEEVKEEKKRDIFQAIRRSWNGFDESQIIYMSINENEWLHKKDLLSEGYSQLLSKMKELLPLGLRGRLAKSFWYTNNVVTKVMHLLKTVMAHETSTDKQRLLKMKEHLRELEHVYRMPDSAQKILKYMLDEDIAEGARSLQEYLRRTQVRQNLTTWEEKDCPARPGDVSEMEYLVNDAITRRVRNHISEWERQGEISKRMQMRLRDKLEEHLHLIEGKFRALEMRISRTNVRDFASMPTISVLKLLDSTEIWHPLANLSMQVKSFQPMTNKEFMAMATYRRNKSTELSKAMTTFLLKLDDIAITRFMYKHSKDVLHPYDVLLNRITRLIASDMKLLKHLKEVKEKSKTQHAHNALLEKCHRIMDELRSVYVTEVMKYDVDASLVQLQETFDVDKLSSVYAGTMVLDEWDDNPQNKCLRILQSSRFISENSCRRCIHPYIAEMFGSCLLRIRGDDKPWPTLILEHCPYTLADVVRSPSYQPLGQMNARGVSQWMAPTEYACQMASALGFLHENGLTIQPDFNENTVLVTKDFSTIRLMGYVEAPAKLGIGERNGSALEETTESLDVYCFGLILLFMWYGRTIENVGTGALKQLPNRKPAGTWGRVVENCLSQDLGQRPSASHCSEEFSNLAQSLRCPAGQRGRRPSGASSRGSISSKLSVFTFVPP